MAANKAPIFVDTPNVKIGTTLTTANTAKDGTGTVVLAFEAGADGAYCDVIRLKPLGTNVQSVVRAFVNNGSDPTTATNNALCWEQTLPATTLSETGSLAEIEIPIGKMLPAGYRIYLAIGTTVSAGWIPVGFGGDY